CNATCSGSATPSAGCGLCSVDINTSWHSGAAGYPTVVVAPSGSTTAVGQHAHETLARGRGHAGREHATSSDSFGTSAIPHVLPQSPEQPACPVRPPAVSERRPAPEASYGSGRPWSRRVASVAARTDRHQRTEWL